MVHRPRAELWKLMREDVHPIVERAPRRDDLDRTVLGLHFRALGWATRKVASESERDGLA